MGNALVKAGVIAVVLSWALAAHCVLAGEAQRYVQPGSRAAGLTACVEPTDFMRRNHMELIKHQRDATVHQGIRGTRHSLAGCVACHVSAAPPGHPLAINGPDQFCGACHAFSAVDVNCFGCHAAVPRGGPLSEQAVAGAHTATQGAAGHLAGPSQVDRPAVDRGEGR